MKLSLKNKTIGILSSWTENCGNASYTKQLIEELSKHYKKADCIHLNQKLIHSGVSVEDEVLSEVKKYDFINIQYEAALFGKTAKRSHNFLRRILNSHDNISITIHSIFIKHQIDPKKRFSEFKISLLRNLTKLGIIKDGLSSSDYSCLKFLFFVSKQIKLGKKIHFIVHREELVDFMEKFDIPSKPHPIVAATNRDIKELNLPETRLKFLKTHNLDESKTYVGIFGFLGEYKGFDVALKALASLPENFHIIMCCQKHPMFGAGSMATKRKKVANNGLEPDEQTRILNAIITENNLSNRVHYVNHLINEEDFKLAVAGTDIPLFPYYEVGQGGSGPISYAIHLNNNAKIIASRTKAFEDYYNDYYPECFTFFDQGNDLELAYKIQNAPSLKNNIIEAQKNYGVDGNIQVYLNTTLASA